ncbi:peptidase M23 [Thalassotalea sp. HSM 43]|uniref:murein hydrolase activator EnvC family protein n=1 Tax=Thalassotalea sp. HSM 43 TaxID=2552945 RepID=UPI00108158B8|nr:peptidoglycan DD-metalloendopeptidase family protein [Thalassotalea sp. HSM 43]QBY04163.1 peptidase M23 [Thalassotalea sp. HSM 43]
MLCCFLPISSLATEQQKQDTRQDLSDVKKQIASHKDQLQQNNQQVESIQKQLRKDDLAIASVARKVKDTNTQQTQTRAKIADLRQQQQQLQKQKQQQEGLLAEQIRSAYSSGHHDYLKLLLNQQKPEQVQRTLTYYSYLNDARMQSIGNFQDILQQLADVEQEQQIQADKLQALAQEQKQQQQQMLANQGEREKTLKSLNSKILTSKQRLNKLEGEEKSLIQTLARIQAQLQKQKELTGLSKLKRKLKWPVRGRIAHSFGTKKQGYLRWKGVMMNAPVGRDIKAIHDGTVLFSDWLKGYGLVIVVDHGDGYMSLYGHNQALLKNVGDRVEIGEPIALVGQSGGVSQSGVYFEIRHKGKPVNPKLWCR